MKSITLLCTILFATILTSCSSNSDRLIAAMTAEIGSSPAIKAQGSSHITYTWESVSLVKKDVLKNIADKELKIQPIKTQDLESATDENGNPLPGKIQQYWIYETEKNSTVLKYYVGISTIDVMLSVKQK